VAALYLDASALVKLVQIEAGLNKRSCQTNTTRAGNQQRDRKRHDYSPSKHLS